MKVAEVPEDSDTEVGIVSRELLTLSCTFLSAWTSRVSETVQVAMLPEVNAVGLQLTEETASVSNMINEPVWEAPFIVAVRVTVSFETVVLAVAVKAVEVTPAGTVTVAGIASRELSSERVTTLPPDAAG